MKRLLLGAALTLALGQMAFGTLTDKLKIVSGAFSATFTDNGGCVGSGCATLVGDINPTAGTTAATGTINGWTISISQGTSNSPVVTSTVFGIDMTNLTATCTGAPGVGCSVDALAVTYSDINFTTPNSSFVMTYSSTQTGATASTTATAWDDTTNTLFGMGTLIGSVGPFVGTGGFAGSVSGGGPAGPAPYALTKLDVFSSGGGPASFSSDDMITGVPEPASVVLFGSVLIVCASRFRRRKVS